MLQLYGQRQDDRMTLITFQAEDLAIYRKIACKKLPQTDCATNADSQAIFKVTAQISKFEHLSCTFRGQIMASVDPTSQLLHIYSVDQPETTSWP